jgi:MFS transporter, DHA2 family, multidrug resistance protein
MRPNEDSQRKKSRNWNCESMTENTYALPFVPRWLGFLALSVGMFMAILDIQVVVTSLKSIEEALQIGPELMSWVQTTYIIAEVIAIPVTALLTRVLSMRYLFGIALGFFTFASLGCALSYGFSDLLAWRVLQGFAGGVLIPLVFSAIFLLFPKGLEQTFATGIAGFLAVLGPAFGPIIGGWLTEHYSWHWLFLINIVPGILATFAGLVFLPRIAAQLRMFRELDWPSLISFGVSLALLIIGLKEAPSRGWLSPVVLGCFAISVAGLIYAVKRPHPAIMFYLLKDRALAYGCALSFLLGFLLFSSVYILPVYLGFVRGLGPLAIGLVVLTMGLTQLVAAPFTVLIDRYLDARLLTAIGFIIFAAGLGANSYLTVTTEAADLFWPLVLRGAAIALCILPPIRIALALMPIDKVSDASGLFNLVRNIGGVIGIAVMDTVMFSRAPDHVQDLIDLARSSPATAAPLLGVTVDELPDPEDAMGIFGLSDLAQSAGLTMAINEAWLLLAVLSLLALPLLWMLGNVESAKAAIKRG